MEQGKVKAVFNWSGGKDSAHALLRAAESGKYDIVALLTTVSAETERSTMHDIPMHLLQAQSRALGIPLDVLALKPSGDMDDYTWTMEQAVLKYRDMGVRHFIFGDIFLHDVLSYRRKALEPWGIEVVEPLWGKSSARVMQEYLSSGLKTMIVTTMDESLGEAAIGKVIDREFVDSLPEGCDPNGENGEYHTFCYDGPIFAHPVPFSVGTPVKRSYDIRLDDGSVRTYSYWFASLE